MNRPSNWYQMTWEEQRDWQRQKQAYDDLEYEASRAREDAERARADYNSTRREMRQERDEWERQQERINELEADKKELLAALELALRYLENPEVQAIPFALPASAAVDRARAAIHKATA